ncbi:S53 family peptidase [Flexivirga lutea]
MRKFSLLAAISLAASAGAVGGMVPAANATTGHGAGVHAVHSCATAKAGQASCDAVHLVNSAGQNVGSSGRLQPAAAAYGKPVKPSAISGKTPTDIQSAYKLSGLKSGGRTVAIVDAYGYPNAERDLGVYRSQFGLPSCTKANGCLTIMSQTGSTSSLPRTDVGWSQEQALDLDAVSAACPDCKIVLVQAKSASFADLGAAVNQAAKVPGVVAISNSYGGGDAPDSTYGSYYNHPGIAVAASTGDNGYQGASFPASSHYVTAVGGTSLSTASNSRGWTESAWSGAGSGCSTSNVAPAGQDPSATHCAGRAMADVSAVADPNTGLAVYAPTSSRSSSWAQYGGTSLSSPLVASVYALSGNTSGYANTKPYANPSALFDVTTGSNGSNQYWSNAGVGWDGPTGLGTPNGTAAF